MEEKSSSCVFVKLKVLEATLRLRFNAGFKPRSRTLRFLVMAHDVSSKELERRAKTRSEALVSEIEALNADLLMKWDLETRVIGGLIGVDFMKSGE